MCSAPRGAIVRSFGRRYRRRSGGTATAHVLSAAGFGSPMRLRTQRRALAIASAPAIASASSCSRSFAFACCITLAEARQYAAAAHLASRLWLSPAHLRSRLLSGSAQSFASRRLPLASTQRLRTLGVACSRRALGHCQRTFDRVCSRALGHCQRTFNRVCSRAARAASHSPAASCWRRLASTHQLRTWRAPLAIASAPAIRPALGQRAQLRIRLRHHAGGGLPARIGCALDVAFLAIASAPAIAPAPGQCAQLCIHLPHRACCGSLVRSFWRRAFGHRQRAFDRFCSRAARAASHPAGCGSPARIGRALGVALLAIASAHAIASAVRQRARLRTRLLRHAGCG
jgi:hypothetical protein